MRVERILEVGGKNYVVTKEEGAEGASYSMDAGKTWHPTLSEAYVRANEAGSLLCVSEPADGEGDGESLQAFIVSLVSILQDLSEGESIRVARGRGVYSVTKECEVLVTRASTIQEGDS